MKNHERGFKNSLDAFHSLSLILAVVSSGCVRWCVFTLVLRLRPLQVLTWQRKNIDQDLGSQHKISCQQNPLRDLFRCDLLCAGTLKAVPVQDKLKKP